MEELLEEKVKFKQQPLSDYVLKDGYTPEEVYGAQEGRGFLNKINREKFIRPGTYEATPEEIDANFDMQDGIMAAEGGRIGFAGGSNTSFLFLSFNPAYVFLVSSAETPELVSAKSVPASARSACSACSKL